MGMILKMKMDKTPLRVAPPGRSGHDDHDSPR
jgi:hypothetical protein